MIFAFVRSLIGNFGRSLMDFYIQNSLIINSIVLLYGLIIFIGRRNYFVILEKLIIELKGKNPKFEKSGVKKINQKEYQSIAWDAVKKGVKFPLFTAPKKWGLKRTTIIKLKEEFNLEILNSLLSGIDKNQER